MRRLVPVLGLGLLLAACGAPAPKLRDPGTAAARRSVVWLGASGVDDDTAVRLAAAGVDEVVLPMGTVFAADSVPVLRLVDPPAVSEALPLGVELRLELPTHEVEAELADALWNAISRELGKLSPEELLFDLPKTPAGTDLLLQRLEQQSGLPVRPVVTVAQLADPSALAALRAGGGGVILCFGRVGLVRPGAETSTLPLDEQLAPVAALGVRPRLAVVVRPSAQPEIPRWGPLDPLTEGHATEISTTSALDRTFRFRRAMEWSGRSWAEGSSVALSWSDAARLDSALADATRLVLPQAGGWDVIGLPPADAELGMTREALLAYLRGEGPEPEIEVSAVTSWSTVRVGARNPSPFGTAVSAFGNWVEVAVPRGTVSVADRGGFDAFVLGNGRGDAFRRADSGPASVVRLLETYVAPGEAIAAATLRVGAGPGAPDVVWHVTLSTGEAVEGRASSR